jgi:hypothetical protein
MRLFDQMNPANIISKIPPRSGYYTFQMNEGYKVAMYLDSTHFEQVGKSCKYRVIISQSCGGCHKKVYLDQKYAECGDKMIGATVRYIHETCK